MLESLFVRADGRLVFEAVALQADRRRRLVRETVQMYFAVSHSSRGALAPEGQLARTVASDGACVGNLVVFLLLVIDVFLDCDVRRDAVN